MIILIDITKDGQGKNALNKVEAAKKYKSDYEYIDASICRKCARDIA